MGSRNGTGLHDLEDLEVSGILPFYLKEPEKRHSDVF